MALRSRFALLTLLASSAVLVQPAEAAVYGAPDPANPLESRIQNLRAGAWGPWLERSSPGAEPDLARAWGNGGNRGWGNARGGGGVWGNGGGVWGNGGRWGNGGGWGNGGAGWLNGGYGRGFVNW